jgi:predicted DNA-binding transcriptional regulator YafY
MKQSNHDTLVHRLAMVLVKLNQGESLDPQVLAVEFGVNLRTIQRDLNQRFGYLPLEKFEGRYRLDPTFLGKLSAKDIERFAGLAGVKGLFPSLSDDFLRDVFDSRVRDSFLVKGHHYEDLSGKEALFKQIESAVVAKVQISFRYLKRDRSTTSVDAQPYKLLNHKGIWYLAAVSAGKLKTYSFSRIEALMASTVQFDIDPLIEAKLLEQDGIWMSDAAFEVVLSVSPEVSGYFKRRRLIANQVIVKELEDGGLIVSAKVGHMNQVLPHVRYWIPHLRVISPDGLQFQLENELQGYLRGTSPKESQR